MHIFAEKLRSIICQQVRDAGYYSIIVDECRDVAKQEQLTFVVRFVNVNDFKINEHFLGFIHAKHLNAESLSEYIKGLITGYDFDLNKLVSQGYDGARVMSGQFAPHALYIHCYAHVLNLVLVDSIKSVKSAYEFFTLLEVLYVFMSTSKVHVILIEKQQQLNPNRQHMELQKLSDTRWICRYAAVNAVCRTFDAILLTIEEVAESTDASKAIEARGLYNQVKSFSFLISLITFDKILICTKQLSEQLQSSTVDLSHASELVLATMSLLIEYRTNDYWERIYTYTSEIAKLHEIDSHTFDIERRQRKRPAHLNDSVLLESVGNREPLSTSQN